MFGNRHAIARHLQHGHQQIAEEARVFDKEHTTLTFRTEGLVRLEFKPCRIRLAQIVDRIDNVG